MGLLEKMKIKVMKQTADGLKEMAKDCNITIGEVVDRLTVQIAPTDPELASYLLMQQAILITSQLSEESRQDVLFDFLRTFFASCPPESLDEIVEEVKQARKDMIDKLGSLTPDDQDKLIETLRDLKKIPGEEK